MSMYLRLLEYNLFNLTINYTYFYVLKMHSLKITVNTLCIGASQMYIVSRIKDQGFSDILT